MRGMEAKELFTIVMVGSFGGGLMLVLMFWHANKLHLGERTRQNYIGTIFPPALMLFLLWALIS